ncbi:hypothetical protein [Sporosarcina sp. FSL K6-5500]|uniref:hypothetical protein n=1 Tax=Sporosarcina sp. FSL K6-5500 TaxID=2921558 RepID=UPI0030F95025
MDIRNDIECVLKWHEEIITLKNKGEFMKYLYDFLNEYFRGLINNRHDKFKISYEPHEITVTIFREKFTARVEGDEVAFIKESNQDKALIGRYVFDTSFDSPHYLLDEPIRQFHPYCIVRLLEYAFEDFSKKSEEIQKGKYRPY